jgi:hypothetical protein
MEGVVVLVGVVVMEGVDVMAVMPGEVAWNAVAAQPERSRQVGSFLLPLFCL